MHRILSQQDEQAFIKIVQEKIDIQEHLIEQAGRAQELESLIKDLHLLSKSEESVRNIVKELFYRTGVALYGESDFIKSLEGEFNE